ncbi:MAG: hypothetical protein IJ125_09950 [Atopobiaceae bacterium]|nr:hypothetical protein [Atopobiaceae bacterium]
MSAPFQAQAQVGWESSDSHSADLFFDTWKPKQPFSISFGACALLLGFCSISIYLLTQFLPDWKAIPIIGELDYTPLMYAGVAAFAVGVVVLIASLIIGRTVPLKANIENEIVLALREAKILPEKLRAGGFKHRIKVSRKDGIAYVFFRIQYPGRDSTDVLPMARHIETAFSKVEDYDLIATTGKLARQYPLTLVLHYRKER